MELSPVDVDSVARLATGERSGTSVERQMALPAFAGVISLGWP
jgi:hypothetical protein